MTKGRQKREKRDAGAKKETKIDFAGISQRIVALPVPDRAYADLQTADGKLFYGEFIPNKPGFTLNTFEFKTASLQSMLKACRLIHSVPTAQNCSTKRARCIIVLLYR